MTARETMTERIEARIVLLAFGSREMLATPSHPHSQRLIRVQVSITDRLAPQVHHALQTRYGLRGMVLDFLSAPRSTSLCVAFEVSNVPASKALHAVAVDAIPTTELSQNERMTVLKLQAARDESPLTRPGWIDEAIAWIESTTHKKVTSKQDIEQYNAGSGFGLLRFSLADGRRVWLKATARSNVHELSVSCLLASLCADFVPEVLGIHTRWNAWLMADLETSVSTPSRESVPWNRKLGYAVEALAALQRRTMGHEAELLAVGAFDQRIPRLRADSHAMFERIEEAMALQTSTEARRIDGARVRVLRSIFDRACDVVEALNMPAALIHGDMNADNLIFASNRCWFLDWCEAYVGWPFVTLQHLLLLNQPGDKATKPATDQALIARYSCAMGRALPESSQNCAIACMPLLAAASALYGRGEWIEGSLEQDPRRQVHVRTLARHMDRASQSADLLEVIQAHSSAATSKCPFASRREEAIDAALPT